MTNFSSVATLVSSATVLDKAALGTTSYALPALTIASFGTAVALEIPPPALLVPTYSAGRAMEFGLAPRCVSFSRARIAGPTVLILRLRPRLRLCCLPLLRHPRRPFFCGNPFRLGCVAAKRGLYTTPPSSIRWLTRLTLNANPNPDRLGYIWE